MIYLINTLTIFRAVIGLAIFYLIQFDFFLLSLLLFFVASITDYFDGYFARRYNVTSVFGEILDPIADKILITFLLIALCISLNSILIGICTSIIISRELLISALRDFNSRKANSNATKVSYLAKIKTTIQLLTILCYLIGLASKNNLLIVISDFILIIATIITIFTGFQYLVNTFKK
tara:strand:- start:3844 stop:4377 length:534 start_codon:yes stop_codon:yes gene_type:complete